MTFIKDIFRKNVILAYLGLVFFIIAGLLTLYALFNPVEVLGVNSMIKPIKFCLSTFLYAWTMALLLHYVNNQKRVKWYSFLAFVVMFFENIVIIIQAFRGKLSHFNQSELVGGILYALMGVMIVWLTTATLVITLRFLSQKTYTISRPLALSIKIGLVMFVIFSFFGGYMSAVNSHNIGGEMGQAGLPLLNWSTLFGDLRVGHFFGIHSLQVMPLLGYFLSNNIKDDSKAIGLIWLGSLVYFSFICFTIYQATHAIPFII
ncbi:MAG: hypothetical protein IPO92_19180 [Saprospiraceae bacterium]|nr:hypothetical protein [Saprospiraceae bacterium]